MLGKCSLTPLPTSPNKGQPTSHLPVSHQLPLLPQCPAMVVLLSYRGLERSWQNGGVVTLNRGNVINTKCYSSCTEQFPSLEAVATRKKKNKQRPSEVNLPQRGCPAAI